MAVIVQIGELVAPLCYYSEGILEECHDNEEAANSRKIAGISLATSSKIRAQDNIRTRRTA